MDLTQRIIGAAMAVHRVLGPGLDEKIYENSLCVEFTAQSLAFTQQQHFPVFYRNQNEAYLLHQLHFIRSSDSPAFFQDQKHSENITLDF